MLAIVVLCALAALTSASTYEFTSRKYDDYEAPALSNDLLRTGTFRPKIDHFRPQDDREAEFVSVYARNHIQNPLISCSCCTDLHPERSILCEQWTDLCVHQRCRHVHHRMDSGWFSVRYCSSIGRRFGHSRSSLLWRKHSNTVSTRLVKRKWAIF